MKLYTKLSIFIATITINCGGQPANYQSIAPQDFYTKISENKNPQILDVRTPEEFANQKIEGAKNINNNDASFEENASKLDKTKPVFVYCLSGGRSKQAANKLYKLGFKTIYELDGGIMKWNAAGLAKPDIKQVGITNNEYKLIVDSNEISIVNFYAEWCAPCKKMKPYLLELEKELPKNSKLIRIDADKNKSIVESLKIDQLPVIIIYKNNKIVFQHAGFLSENDLKKQLQ